MMDEKLIGEVQQHAIIYNRQKSNTLNGDKCITKELAWQDIARNLGSDVDTCKKRWKYLRERYVQQKKVGGSPSYEHLSRPYLEKMKFLDNFIQSRKSYRQVGLFTNPSSMLQHSFDGNESSKSNSSMRMVGSHLNADTDDAFPQYYHLNSFPHANLMNIKTEGDASPETHDKQLNSDMKTGTLPSSSSSIASQESPATLLSNSTTHEMDDASLGRKRRRMTSTSISDRTNLHNNLSANHTHTHNHNHTHTEQQILNSSENDEDQNSINNDDASDHQQSSSMDNTPIELLYPLYEQQQSQRFRRSNEHNSNTTSSAFPNPAELLHPLFQQAMTRQLRNSDQLLGELVTSELLKMSRDRKKVVQKKILEILFFDDD